MRRGSGGLGVPGRIKVISLPLLSVFMSQLLPVLTTKRSVIIYTHELLKFQSILTLQFCNYKYM